MNLSHIIVKYIGKCNQSELQFLKKLFSVHWTKGLKLVNPFYFTFMQTLYMLVTTNYIVSWIKINVLRAIDLYNYLILSEAIMALASLDLEAPQG